MADSLPPSVVSLLGDIVGALITQQAQIAELQTDRTTLLETSERLSSAVTTLQGHAETVTGDTGLTSQLGDLSKVPELQQQLAAVMPVAAEAVPITESSTGTAAPAQSPSSEATAA